MSSPNPTCAVFDCIDAHTCGNPVRVVTSNRPALRGDTMGEKRRHFLSEYDWIRTGLMFEPRGHDAMSGSILYPPSADGHDLGVLFIEVSGCLPMCGHGAIGTVTVALEHGLVTPQTPGLLKLDTPAGSVEARYEMDGSHVDSVTLENVPAFLHSTGLEIEIPVLGRIELDVSYGGNFYAIIEPQPDYPGLDAFSVDDIRRYSPEIRNRINELGEFVHPEDDSIRGVSHVMWTDRAVRPEASMRNVVLYGDRGIDRSPCGTGTCARMAQLVARGDLEIGQPFVHESVIGSLFTGCAIRTARVGSRDAIIPTVTGWARVTGQNRIRIDDRDPYAHGFLLA
ncbi:MAG: 4-hydroxyproline epimerase [Gammaproteobacteria bacterium]|nr:4-hydroxyproline epimerase [Gammaproteobacteria bacterium]MYD75920.1 4-hydroxyproline epimerase [Gammaproteobacteria bacterium]MYJ52328.1 4-hydroxyproline epimerase [Gammaproteobacteria bacterium]